MRSNTLMMVVANTLMVIGSGCTSTQYVIEPLLLPQRPVLPSLSAADVSCLSGAVYRRLVERERLRREFAEKLEAVILSTHVDEW
jgi:hypothetical protein